MPDGERLRGSSGASGRARRCRAAGVPRTRWQLTHDCGEERRLALAHAPGRPRPAATRSPSQRSKFVRRIDDHAKQHVRRAACRSTRRTGRGTGPASFGLRATSVIGAAGNQVHLAAQPRHPKAVADVGRFQRQVRRAATCSSSLDRNVQLVGRDEAERAGRRTCRRRTPTTTDGRSR